MKNIFKSVRAKFEDLPDKKKYIEFISALLSLPVLITVVLLNLNNLRRIKQTEDMINTTPQPTSVEITKVQVAPSPEVSAPVCKKGIGPIEIIYPKEGQRVADNPFCLEIFYKDDTYCPVVWSYRINSGKWSDFTDKSICIYNLESGEKKLDLKVKSLSGGGEIILTREFIYENEDIVPTPTRLPTPTLTLTPTLTPLPQPSVTPASTPASPSGILQQ